MHHTILSVDLAKHVIQVCRSVDGEIESNKSMNPERFMALLVESKPMTVIFEACGMSNYWHQQAQQYGHDARLVSAKLVAKVRQGQKTDANDAIAILQAAQLSHVRFIPGKTLEQQQLQSMVRIRELTVSQKEMLRKQLIGLLSEFNIRVVGCRGGLLPVIDAVLEDAENEFSGSFRDILSLASQHYQQVNDSIKGHDKALESAMRSYPECEKLSALEGVGTINAINLFVQLGGAESQKFACGSDASACIGLTPIQHSTGGKAKLGSIGRQIKNKSVRSYLVSGAMSAVNQAVRREAKTKKDAWIQQLVARRGKRCAAVALANKTVRTAFVMLRDGTEYCPEPLAT